MKKKKKIGIDRERLQLLYKMHDEIYKAYQCLRDEESRHEYNMKLKHDKSRLYNEKSIIGNPKLEEYENNDRRKAEFIKEDLSIKEIGKLNFKWSSGLDDFLKYYEIAIINKQGEIERYKAFSEIVWSRYAEDKEYRYFVKNTLLNPENIRNCCKYTSSYLGIPVKKDGKYKLDYTKEHVTATRKKEINDKILKDIVSKAEGNEER